MEAARFVYLLALGLLAACFLDAPWRLLRLSQASRRLRWRPYDIANGLAILVGLAWLALAVWPAFETLWGVGPSIPTAIRLVGAGAALAGASWAAWARVTLARDFLPTAAVRPEGRLVVTGPFRFMRHPFYSGAWLTLAAGALALQSWSSLAAAGLMIPLLQVLAWGEERLLREVYGTEYSAYEVHVGRFLPRFKAWRRRGRREAGP